jgi:acyl carrier protein
MADEAIEDKIRKMIVERLMMKIQPSEIGLEDDLMKKWDADSVKIMEIVIGLEENFGISVADEDFGKGNFLTVKAISAFVKKRLPE